MGGEHATSAEALLTVDVEEYFQVEALASVVKRSDWSGYEPRVERNTRRVLDLFDEAGARGTFFVVGWIAERYPGLVREIGRRGHEIGCHSYWHQPIYRMGRAEFSADTAKAKAALEHLTGAPILGYRAPTFSVVRDTLWALEVLAEQGFRYDASVYPIRHDNYGIADWSRSPQAVETGAGPILEVPGSTVRWCGVNLPCGGGGYLRLLPLRYNLIALRHIWTRDGIPGVIYMHPWEFDPGQPRFSAGFFSAFRHYTGLRRMEERVRRVLREFRVGPIAEAMSARLGRLRA